MLCIQFLDYQMDFDTDLHEGTKIGKYIIDTEIGNGAFSTVYLSHHEKTNEKYALKVICRKTAEQQDMIGSVDNELRIFSRLNHPNIAKVFDIYNL